MNKHNTKPGIKASRQTSRESSQGQQKRDYQKALEGLFGVKIANENASGKKVNSKQKFEQFSASQEGARILTRALHKLLKANFLELKEFSNIKSDYTGFYIWRVEVNPFKIYINNLSRS